MTGSGTLYDYIDSNKLYKGTSDVGHLIGVDVVFMDLENE